MRISFPFGPQSTELLGKQCARLSACLLDKNGSTASHLNAFYAQSALRSCTSSVPGWYLTQNASKASQHGTETHRNSAARVPVPVSSPFYWFPIAPRIARKTSPCVRISPWTPALWLLLASKEALSARFPGIDLSWKLVILALSWTSRRRLPISRSMR